MKTKTRYKVKNCNKCGVFMPLSSFHKNPNMADGHLNQCPDCKWRYDNNYDDYQKNYYHENKEKVLRNLRERRKQKRKSDYRYIAKCRHYDMKKRVKGKQQNHKGAIGTSVCDWKEFWNWCRNNKYNFDKIHEVWEASGFARKYAPSIDRIDNDKGYIPSNMRWITVSKNAQKHED